jgi:hypothetical protein
MRARQEGQPGDALVRAWLPNANPVSKEWWAQVKPAPIMHPDTDQRIPGTVGTAFDYRLRYYLALTPLEDPARLRRVRAMSSFGSSATTRTGNTAQVERAYGRSRSAGRGGLGGGWWCGVVLAGSLEDCGIDQGEYVLARPESGRLDDRLHPSACGDGAGGYAVRMTVQVGAGERDAGVALVEPPGVFALVCACGASAPGRIGLPVGILLAAKLGSAGRVLLLDRGAPASGASLRPRALTLGAGLGTGKGALECLALRPVSDRAVADAERLGGRDLGHAGGQHLSSSAAALLAQAAPLLRSGRSQGLCRFRLGSLGSDPSRCPRLGF